MPRHHPLVAALFAFLLLPALMPRPVAAQRVEGLPRPSQWASVSQRVGITEIRVTYHRPLVKEREIWGALVPYGVVWRAGANENTVVSLSHAVKVEGEELAAGEYGLHMLPTPGEWTVIFSRRADLWGSFGYDPAHDALRVRVEPRPATFREAMAFEFDDLSQYGATLALHWAELAVPLRIEVDTQALVIAKLEDHLARYGSSWEAWYSAVDYCVDAMVCTELALEWIGEALALEENVRTLRAKSILLGRTGQDADARRYLERALAAATVSETNSMGYYFLFNEEPETAVEIFRRNVAARPEEWYTHDSLADALSQIGEVESAIEKYRAALERAPEKEKARIEAALANLERRRP